MPPPRLPLCQCSRGLQCYAKLGRAQLWKTLSHSGDEFAIGGAGGNEPGNGGRRFAGVGHDQVLHAGWTRSTCLRSCERPPKPMLRNAGSVSSMAASTSSRDASGKSFASNCAQRSSSHVSTIVNAMRSTLVIVGGGIGSGSRFDLPIAGVSGNILNCVIVVLVIVMQRSEAAPDRKRLQDTTQNKALG